jgi:glycosyltransferase involved in cell wall biosynthesis
VVGGGERYAAEYTRALNQVTPAHLASLDYQEGPDFEENGLIRKHLMTDRPVKRRWTPGFSNRAWAALAEYDVVHLMCYPTPIADAMLFSALLRRQLCVLTDIGGGGGSASGYLTRVHPFLSWYRLADGLAHLSRHARSLSSANSLPDTILLGGAHFSPVEIETVQPPFALFVGRLLPHKGVLELIQAMPPEYELKVVGSCYDPVYFQKLQAAAKGRKVVFRTKTTDAELARLYSESTVVLQPSIPSPHRGEDRSELLGLVTLEAQTMGKPVIVTRTTSLPELVKDRVTGFIVPPSDLQALQMKLRQILSDPELARTMGRQAEQHARSNFTWKATAQRGLDFYRKLRERRLRGS